MVSRAPHIGLLTFGSTDAYDKTYSFLTRENSITRQFPGIAANHTNAAVVVAGTSALAYSVFKKGLRPSLRFLGMAAIFNGVRLSANTTYEFLQGKPFKGFEFKISNNKKTEL